MPGTYGNDNLARVVSSQYLSVDGSSDTITLPVGTQAVTLKATAAMWVTIGQPGEDPTAAAPGAEKTVVARTFYLGADSEIDVPVPMSTDAELVKIAAIQDSAGGTLYVYHRRF